MKYFQIMAPLILIERSLISKVAKAMCICVLWITDHRSRLSMCKPIGASKTSLSAQILKANRLFRCTPIDLFQDTLRATQALVEYALRDTNRDLYRMLINIEASSTPYWKKSVHLQRGTFSTINVIKVNCSHLAVVCHYNAVLLSLVLCYLLLFIYLLTDWDPCNVNCKLTFM